MIETTRDACIFSTLNQSQSSFAKFVFNRPFFSSFRNSCPLKCRVNLKSILLALRSLNSTKKCVFALDGKKNELIFQIENHHGITTEYVFSFDDLESILQAEISRIDLNLVSSRAKLFQSKILDNFATGLQEISITPTSNSLITKSYFEADSKNRLFYTECSVSSSDFQDFRIIPNTFGQEIIFPIKEMKAMVTFCRDLDYNVNLYFGMPGHPLVISNFQDSKLDQTVEVVVSTLGDPDAVQTLATQPDDKDQQSQLPASPKSVDIVQPQSQAPNSASSPFTPTQDASWPSNNKNSASQKKTTQPKDDRSEVDSKVTFDLYPPDEQDDIVYQNSSSTKKRKVANAFAEAKKIENDERIGSDSDGEFVAGTPESD